MTMQALLLLSHAVARVRGRSTDPTAGKVGVVEGREGGKEGGRERKGGREVGREGGREGGRGGRKKGSDRLHGPHTITHARTYNTHEHIILT